MKEHKLYGMTFTKKRSNSASFFYVLTQLDPGEQKMGARLMIQITVPAVEETKTK